MIQTTTQIDNQSTNRLKLGWGIVVGGVAILATYVVIQYFFSSKAQAQRPVAPTAPRTAAPRAAAPRTAPRATAPRATAKGVAPTTKSKLKVVAIVNGDQVTRQELASECLEHYGKEVLKRVVYKYLIMQECHRRKLTVTREEINNEIERMAKEFSVPVDQWMKMLQEERGIEPEQYASDILLPILALRKLSKSQMEITPLEIQKEFETQYGPSVKVRLIVCDDASKAAAVHAQLISTPDDFAKVAQTESIDAPSASVGGLIAPVRRHVGFKEVEQVAFQMKPGEISKVIPVNKQFVILKCEGHLPGRQVAIEQVKIALLKTLRDRKMRTVTSETFRKLKESATIVDLLKDPSKKRTMPGMAAVINGQKITEHELAELCIERYGKEVLKGTINRHLLVQACKRHQITVTKADLDEEIRRAASLMIELKPDGSSDVERWIEIITAEQGISEELYRSDAVWPSVVLKKLVEGKVKITDEELQRGFEANYGPRVRCLIIMSNDLRRTKKVWELARKDPSNENFAKLASQYSIDSSSRALGGEIPPIHIHGGKPTLEKAAFALKPGELSGIIATGPKVYVILKCLGRTTPMDVKFEEVRDLIYEDVFEKKQRLAMREYFQKIKDSARIENYLARTSQSPKRTNRLPIKR